MATALSVILIVVVPVLAAVAGLILVQRLVPPTLREEHNDVAGFIYAVIGVAYAVLLAFVVVVVWEEFREASLTVESEANELAGLYFLADEFPDPSKERVQDLVRSYARTVVEDEWPLMAEGKESNRANTLLRELRLAVQDAGANAPVGEVLIDQSLTRLHEMGDARRIRLLEAREGLPTILWVVLVGGAVVTVGFTYLFGLKNNWVHAVMVACLTLLICGILFTISALEYPFAGEVKVQPQAIEQVLRSFGKL